MSKGTASQYHPPYKYVYTCQGYQRLFLLFLQVNFEPAPAPTADDEPLGHSSPVGLVVGVTLAAIMLVALIVGAVLLYHRKLLAVLQET